MKIIISSLKNNLCILSLLISFQVLILNCSSTAQSRFDSEKLSNLSQNTEKTFTSDKICEIAKSTTVLILSEDGKSRGTGFLIHKKDSDNGTGFQYKVVTSDHVLTKAGSYQVQTVDKTPHKARKLHSFRSAFSSFPGKDLAVLEFESRQNYQIAEFAQGLNLSPNKTSVIAAGYPLRIGETKESEWVCTRADKVSLVLDQPMKGGYSIGYYLDIRKGMSGGPLFNLQGQVVGVNGKHSNLPFGGRSAYKHEDGTLVEGDLNVLKKSSWAIPMEELASRAISKGICLDYDYIEKTPECIIALPPNPPNPSPTNSPNPSPTIPPNLKPRPIIPPPLPSPKPDPTRNGGYARNSGNDNNRRNLNDNELKQLAEEITLEVRIRKVSGGTTTNSSRSGFVVGKEPYQKGFKYKVVTYLGQKQKGEPKDAFHLYQVVGRGGNSITTVGKAIEIVTSNRDKLVQIEFFDRKESYYEKAQLGAFDLKTGDQVFASGCKTETIKISQEDKPKTECDLVEGTVKSIENNGSQIYLSGSMKINEQMLGGPLINSKGEVIGINTPGESSNLSATSIRELQEYLPDNENVVVDN